VNKKNSHKPTITKKYSHKEIYSHKKDSLHTTTTTSHKTTTVTYCTYIMNSKKHLILNKAKEDFEKRIEQGENIQFNFSCNTCKKRRLDSPITSDDDYYPMSPDAHSSSSEYEEESPIVHTRPQVITRAKQQSSPPTTSSAPTMPTTTRKRSSSNGSSNQKKNNNSNANAQTECCIIGCDNTVTNRLRFSLRCHKEDDFKSEFLDQGWNKVCHYHYFSDLYKFKKMNKASGSSTAANKKKPAAKKTTQKRSREEFENDNSFEQSLTIVPTSVMIEQPLIPCKAVTPNTKIDASIFFSFVGGLSNGSNITKAM
jgi:hypothetical protein